jgi:hypothetical protein
MNFDADEMKALIVDKVAQKYTDDEELWGMVKKRLDAKVDALFSARADELINAAVNSAIQSGFDRTYHRVDQFGSKVGEPTTIRAELDKLIGKYWADKVDANGKPAEGYSAKMTRAEYLMTQICAKDFSDQMRQAAVSVTAALKDGFRAQMASQVDKLLDELFRVKSLQDQGKATEPW